MKIQQDFDLSKILWYKIGGKAKYLLVCESKEDIIQALEFIEKNHIQKTFVCGLGSNLIFSADYFDGAVIQITTPHLNPLPQGESKIKNIDQIPSPLMGEGTDDRREESVSLRGVEQGEGENFRITNDSTVESFAGELLDDVIQFSFAHNLTGLEWAGGLPGTVGAAVRGNVGAFGGEIKDTIESADVLDYSEQTPVLKTLTNDQLQFVYRGSLVKTQKQMIVVSAKFRLQPAIETQDLVSARELYEHNKQYRKDHHPLEYPNCGSVFKNLKDKDQIAKVLAIYPDLKEQVETKWHGKLAVATLIERLGLKGYRIGNAQVSQKHALFVVNLGNAKAQDVLQIIQVIQDTFQEKFGFQLETEVEIVK